MQPTPETLFLFGTIVRGETSLSSCNESIVPRKSVLQLKRGKHNEQRFVGQDATLPE